MPTTTRTNPNGRIVSGDIKLFNVGFKAGKGRATSILVKRSRGLGDVLQVLPAMKSLKRKYGPKTTLTFGTSPPLFPLLRRFSFIDRLIDDRRTENGDQYGLTVDLQDKVDFLPICREASRPDLFANLLEVHPRCYLKQFNFPVSKNEIQNAKAILKRANWQGEKLLGLHLTAYSAIRTWPVDRSLELVRLFSGQRGWKVLILESHAVRERFQQFDHVILPDQTEVIDLLGLLSLCDAFVGPDSGVMHLAGFLQIPSVVLFGPIPSEYRIGYYPKTIGLSAEVDCSPCWDWQTHACYKRPHYRQCLKDITAEMVIAKLGENGCI